MYQNYKDIEEKSKNNLPRFDYIKTLITEYQDTKNNGKISIIYLI